MGFLMLGLLALSALCCKICNFIKNTELFIRAHNSDNSFYTDIEGDIRNSRTGNIIEVGEGNKLYDSITKELVYNPQKKREAEEFEKCRRLNYSKRRIFQTSHEELLNQTNYRHRIIYREFCAPPSQIYGKLNCNLGYQFWVNLTTGYMEETELSKKICHTEVTKYHRVPIDNKKRKVEQYKNDYDRPYTKEEIIRENEEILKHLKNHNNNILRNDLTIYQRFAPSWRYNPLLNYEEIMSYPSNDGLIYEYADEFERKVLCEKKEEGYYD